jgi:two-component system alkaline phosphatase synthesis response regulator PhoP
MAKRILIIEDDGNIRELVRYNLEGEGFECDVAEDGRKGLARAESGGYDLIVLDVMLPGLDGFGILRALRNSGDETPVVMLTAKSDEIDKVVGLELGADDYMTKPFSVRELIARVRARLRRQEKPEQPPGGLDAGAVPDERGARGNAAGRLPGPPGAGEPSDGANDLIRLGDLSIDKSRHEVRVDGRPVALALKEFELLWFLSENRGLLFTRNQILDRVWGYEYLGETRTVDVHVRYLRKKLAGSRDARIETVRGIGYKLL